MNCALPVIGAAVAILFSAAAAAQTPSPAGERPHIFGYWSGEFACEETKHTFELAVTTLTDGSLRAGITLHHTNAAGREVSRDYDLLGTFAGDEKFEMSPDPKAPPAETGLAMYGMTGQAISDAFTASLSKSGCGAAEAKRADPADWYHVRPAPPRVRPAPAN